MRYKKIVKHPTITYASFQTTMAVITIAARISTTPAMAPPTSAPILTEAGITEVGVGKECTFVSEETALTGMNSSSSGMKWVQVAWNGFKWHGMGSSSMKWFKWHGMGSSGMEWVQVA